MADANKRRKAAYFSKNAKKAKTQFSLQPGVKGFLATCNFREKDCVREAINILNEFADKIYGEDQIEVLDTHPQNKKIIFKDSDDESDEKEDDDVEAALAKEVDALKQERKSNPNKRRFQVIESGADNCVFIRTTVEDPVCVVEAILKDIELQSKQKTRFLLRLLPIETTCKAWPEDIKTASGKLLDKYFKGEPKTFSVIFKRRNNSNVLREELIQDLANDIKLRNPLHRADMKQPDLAVIVEVIRNICCMSVVPKYYHYRKYNLIEVAKIKESSIKEEVASTLKEEVAKKESSNQEEEVEEKVDQTDSLKNLPTSEAPPEVLETA
ncbi:hypothetical protein ONE63_006475 [Megalurothrips usitatus]|uniref:THUMP domain-containing protein n=1 Tax=Megalurothrips usitatus TaxID=439358 RepID=A0AAV7XW18_9NEOP|nr:hypothetical protein ONE63_006475 [Megalurothrips usitatus]